MESDKVNEIDRTSRITTLKLIDALEYPEHHIIVEKGKRRGQSHRLVFNDKNEFNTILTIIEGLERINNNFTNGVKDLSLNSDKSFEKYGHNIIHFEQIKFYIGISTLAARIYDSIKSADDRDTLHLKLVKVMAGANKTNKVIMPLVLRGISEFVDELKRSKTVSAKVIQDFQDSIRPFDHTGILNSAYYLFLHFC